MRCKAFIIITLHKGKYMEDIENSMQDKMYKMHHIAFQIELIVSKSYNKISKKYEINNKIMPDNESDMLYDILDGLTEKYIMDRINGHCSLQAMLDNRVEKLESIIDTNIVELLEINGKYDFKIDISEIDSMK